MKGPCFIGIPYGRFIYYLGLKEMSEFLLWRELKSQVMGLFDFAFSETEASVSNEFLNSQDSF